MTRGANAGTREGWVVRRAFITLYALVVFSVLLFGWGLDRVWQHYSPANPREAQPSPETFAVLAFFLDRKEFVDAQQSVTELSRALQQDVTLMQLDDFAQTAFAERLSAGAWTVVDGGSSGTHYYQKLPGSNAVISWREAPPLAPRSLLYEALIVAFYLAMAVVIFIWIWPLSRDLAKLERQTKHLGYQSAPKDLHIGPASAVHDLASAFNRMAQRVRDLLTTQKEMTYAVSHELRTPLARMKFGLEMAAAFDDVERIRDKLAGVREDVTEMDLLVNQLLAYADFEQQERTLDIQSGDLGALVTQLIARLRKSGGDSPVEVVFEDALHGQAVNCEWYLLERALFNLLQNAQRFAQTQIFVRLSQNQGQNWVVVDDDGPGIPEVDRQRIFQSFVRLNNSANSRARGFGLGLSIVQRIMGWHRGRVQVETAPIGGARFVLAWPVDVGRS